MLVLILKILLILRQGNRIKTLSSLSISLQDFVEIFMAGGLKSVTDRDQNSFIRYVIICYEIPGSNRLPGRY